jgi:hypothetical protein
MKSVKFCRHSGPPCPPTAAGKGVALEIGFKGYLGDESQTSPQALPALPQLEGRFYHVSAGNGRAGGLTFSIKLHLGCTPISTTVNISIG